MKSVTSDLNIFDHLEELRKRLIVSLISVGALSVLSFFSSDVLIKLIVAPAMRYIYSLYFFSPYEAFMTKIKVSIVTGLVLSLPVIFYQLWLFVSPGLYPKEKKLVLPLVIISSVLFLIGVLFSYYLVIPFALSFFLNFQTGTLAPLISIGSYLSFFLSLVLIFGFLFDIPVVLIGLIVLGVIKTEFLKAQRKITIVAIFILAAVLTPTVDLFTQCVLAVALWMLFEFSIWVGAQIEKKEKLNQSKAAL